MPFTLTMPKLSPTMEEGSIAKWYKHVGDYIEAGDVLLEVATDKATVEYNAIDSGWLRKILVEEGGEAIVNQAIGICTEEKEESVEGYHPTGATAAPVLQAAPVIADSTVRDAVAPTAARAAAWQQPVFVPEAPLEEYEFAFPTESIEKRILASPLARKLAKEKGLNLATVKGTGPDHRITSRDLVHAQLHTAIGFGQRGNPSIVPGTYVEETLTPMRKVIGQRLQESKSFIPHFYVQQVFDAKPLVAMREQLASVEVKISVNDCIVRACALALRQHPGINSGFNSVKQTVLRFKTVDIAIAVGLPSGLITPIIRHADYKNLGEISVEIKAIAKRAKEGKLEPHEYKGGSFTISNLGMFGVTNFQAIINPPQAAILAVSGIQDIPVIKEGVVVPGKTMSLTLSVDHRVIDGVAAAEFLKTLQKLLENPAALLI